MTAGERLDALAQRYGTPPGFAATMDAVLGALQREPLSLTTVRDPAAAVDVHVADSLVALDRPAVRAAATIADLGSGAGFPGLVLAAGLPRTRVVCVESVGKKAAWIARVAEEVGLANVEVVAGRAEEWSAGLGACDVVTARALAALPVLLEYAAPLLREGGTFVAWKGHRDDSEERDGHAAADVLGLELAEIRAVDPFLDAGERHLYLWSKVRSTPPGYPRRAGMARKRPLRADTRP